MRPTGLPRRYAPRNDEDDEFTMRTHLFIAALSLTALAYSEQAMACATLSEAGQRIQQEQQERYLREKSDTIVRGVWHVDKVEPNPDDDYSTRGYIEVGRGKSKFRYRVSIPGTINCGFPYYYLKDGDVGHFYLKRDEFSDDNELEDGFFDDYTYVHYKPLKQDQ